MPGHRKRRQFKQTDAFTRGIVIGLKRAGWSIRQIAANTHLGASTVHRLWRRWLEQGNVAIYRNVGATRVTSARVDQGILRQAVAAPQATCTAILQHMQDTLDHSISTRTISRRLVANGLLSCRPLRRLPLTPPNRRQRLEWCRARSTWMAEWHRVVFSDESRFCLSSDSRRVRVWRRRGERSNPAAIVERPTVRQRGIMVRGAIAYDSRSPLLRIQGTMTAQRYVDDVLRPVTLPYLQGVPNALYQQDNARPHTARISQQALQDVQMLPWPPYSPDLSPIEHVWDIIGRRLHALPQPRSEDELWQMVEREWRAIPQDAIRTLIGSLPRRVAACIAVRERWNRKERRIQRSTWSPILCYESGPNTTFPKIENTLGRALEVAPSQEDAPPPPVASDFLGSLAWTLHQLSAATGLSRDVELLRYDGSYEAQSFFDNYDAQADRAQLQYTERLRRLPNFLQDDQNNYQPFLRTVTEVQCSATLVSTTQLRFQSTPFILQVLWRHALSRPVPQTACTETSKTCVPSHNLSTARNNSVVFSRTLPSYQHAGACYLPPALYTTSPAQAVNSNCPRDPPTTAPDQACPDPHDSKAFFLGAIIVYNKFIPDYARLRAPLNKLLKKDTKWQWDDKCQQAFTALKESLTHVNGLHTIRGKGVKRIIILEALQHSLMNQVQSEYNHPGISQMARLISTQYNWKGMAKSIQKFVKSCYTCQIIKRPKVDHLTRCAWEFPSKYTSTLTYFKTLKKVLQQGSPKRLLSDRAPAFTSEKFRKFPLSRGIQPLLTTSNNPQANRLIERLNATITGKLRKLGNLLSARTQLKHERDKQRYHNGHQTPHFEIGDLVLVKNYKHPDTGKMAPYFTGPFPIIEIISPNVVRIIRPNRPLNKEDDTVHVNKLNTLQKISYTSRTRHQFKHLA
ncbi:hypothetical protein LAZ67_14002012 [Cordylochernes scorpioides]|uniref:RNA-directed DNA polymerase n=1 Tax=Cordylochernes scorpioides TaxID=51811 RepID=A0ABY6L6M7_9ARAC|nr:hypothetical protein LAZ67_14002012 [Cordylochernes scorpioides]